MPFIPPMLRAEAVPAAVAKAGAKTPVASALSAEKWKTVPLALRERALFSAKVENLRFLRAAQDAMRRQVTAAREGSVMTAERFISEMRAVALQEGLGATGPRDVEDVTTDTRLRLIFDMQARQAAEWARFKVGNDPDILDAYPAQRLTRVEDREVPRGFRKRASGLVPDPDNDWAHRWAKAGEAVGWDGASRDEWVALKASPIWTALSAFGAPYPPFDFASGMGVVDVDRTTAQRLGLIAPGETAKSALPGFNDALEMSTAGLTDADRDSLRERFGDQIRLGRDAVRWAAQSD